MTESKATARLSRMTAATEEPKLDTNDLADLIAVAARPDANGNLHSDSTAWTPTWDFNAGAAEGWNRKASKAAGRYSFAEDGQRFERAQVYAHCVAQAGIYARRAMGSIASEPTLGG